jgi:PAS domain-containing protein
MPSMDPSVPPPAGLTPPTRPTPTDLPCGQSPSRILPPCALLRGHRKAPNDRPRTDSGGAGSQTRPDRYRALVHATSQHVWSWSTDRNRRAKPNEPSTGGPISPARASSNSSAPPHAWLDVVHPRRPPRRRDRLDPRHQPGRHLRLGVPSPRTAAVDGVMSRVRGVPIRDTARRNSSNGSETIDDVTDTRHALLETRSATLAESRRRREAANASLRPPLFNTADFVYLFDTGGRFTFANKPLLDLWKQVPCPRAVGPGLPRTRLPPPKLADRLQSQIRQVVTTARPVRDETPLHLRRRHTPVRVHLHAPSSAPTARSRLLPAQPRDITDRERDRSDLRASEETLPRPRHPPRLMSCTE